MLAAIRPDDVNLPLFVHVLGATVLVGSLLLVTVTYLVGWRRREAAETAALDRFAFRSLLLAALPAFVVMRLGAGWVYSAENWDQVEEDPAWLGIGFLTADIGVPVLLVTLIVAGLAARRGSAGLGKASGVLSAILLAAYVVAMWAMTVKPD